MAITVAQALTTITQSGSSKATWTFTISVPSSTDLLVLARGWIESKAIASADLAGSSLTLGVKRSYANSTMEELWYLVNPPSGSNTLTVSFTPQVTSNNPLGFICLNGINKVTPIGSTVTGGNNSSVTTNDMSVNDGDWGLAIFGAYAKSTTITADDSGNQTVRGNIKAPTGNYSQFTMATKVASGQASNFNMTGSVSTGYVAVAAMIIKSLLIVPHRPLDGPMYGSLKGSVR